MSDRKLTALSAATVASAGDVFYIVTDTGSTPTSKKIAFANLQASLGKQDMITYPLGINSGGTGITATGSATSLVGMNSSGSVYDYFALKASDNVTIVRSGNNYFFSANTGTGASTSGIIYAPTGGFYVTWSSDTLLSSEKILTASDNIVVTTGANNIWISALTSPAGAATAGGSNNQIQVNSQNSLKAYADFYWDETNFILGIGANTTNQVAIGVNAGNPQINITASNGQSLITLFSTNGVESDVIGRSQNGTILAPTSSGPTDTVLLIEGRAYDGVNYRSIAGIELKLDGLIKANSLASCIEFWTNPGISADVKSMILDRYKDLKIGRGLWLGATGGSLVSSSSSGYIYGINATNSDTTIQFNRATSSRFITLPDSSGTFAVASVYPAKLDSGGLISVDTAFLVNTGRLLTASTGLSGGGDLSADRSFSVNTNIRDRTYGFFGAGNVSTAMFMMGARYFIPFNMEARACYVSATTAPTGANIIINLNQWNAGLTASTGMFASANRPNIAASAFVGSSLTFDIGTLYQGSWLGVSVDQCGSTNAGSNLTITFITRSS